MLFSFLFTSANIDQPGHRNYALSVRFFTSVTTLVSIALLLILLTNQALACQPAMPPSCEAGESETACRERVQKWYADQDAARIAYEKKTPEERALIEQAQRWEDHEIIFLARVEKIKLRGKVHPQTEPKAPKPRKGKIPPLPMPVPLLVFPKYGERYQAYLRPMRQIKGPAAFAASWQWVGGMTSCGASNDGDLAFGYPGDEIIIFADWASTSRTVRGKDVVTKYLRLYGLDREELVEPRILAALVEALSSKTEPKP